MAAKASAGKFYEGLGGQEGGNNAVEKVKAFQAKMAAGNVSPPSEPISPDAARGSGDIRDFFGKAPEASPEATNDAAEAETE